MNKKILAVLVAVVALGGIAVLVLSQKHPFSTHHQQHDAAAQTKEHGISSPATVPSPTAASGDSMPAPTTPAATPAGPATPASTASVTIQDFSFSPQTLSVKKGTAVTWTNQDSSQHTVTGDNTKGFASKPLGKGDSYTFTFNAAGTFTYHCSFHSSMTGTVVVTE